jgi:hypothetical protein
MPYSQAGRGSIYLGSKFVVGSDDPSRRPKLTGEVQFGKLSKVTEKELVTHPRRS